MPFSTLFERREKERELERLQVIEEVKRPATALRARFAYDELLLFGSLVSGKFDRHSDIDLAIKGLASDHFFKACAAGSIRHVLRNIYGFESEVVRFILLTSASPPGRAEGIRRGVHPSAHSPTTRSETPEPRQGLGPCAFPLPRPSRRTRRLPRRVP
jgi:predicted nucleotidyltransferase